MIDLYCERLGPGFWGEPVNALSNIVFFVAAWLAWRLANQQKRLSGGNAVLIILVASIGLGSFTFHTFANKWSMILDLVPILLFQLAFFWLYCRKVMELKPAYCAIILSLFLLTIVLGKAFPQYLNGSLMYLPALLLLTALGLFHYRTNKTEPWLVLVASALFLFSFAFRSLDNSVCASFPLGTHFLWHLSCGVILYLLTRVVIVNSLKTEKN